MKKRITALACMVAITSCQTKNEKKTIESTSVHVASMPQIFPKPRVEIKTIGIYVYDGYSPLDALGPYSVFTRLMGAGVFFVAKHKGIITDGRGLKIAIDTSIDEVKHLDMLLLPGGLQQTYEQSRDPGLISWVRSIDSGSKYTTSVCTGAWILGAAGLLKGREATTHWYGKKILADEYGAKIQDTRYAHSGKYWTGAGVSAGIDMSLALLNEIAGEQYTKATMLDLEYDPQPPFKGGSADNTDKDLVEGMRLLYDGSMDAALHPEKIFKNLKFDSPKDLVCGMSITAGVADTVNYKGSVYGFCSAGCKGEFRKNPASFLATK